VTQGRSGGGGGTPPLGIGGAPTGGGAAFFLGGTGGVGALDGGSVGLTVCGRFVGGGGGA
jgi:hypothetical protein